MFKLTRKVKVTVSARELLTFLTTALWQMAQVSEGQGRTFYYVLGHLVGTTDVEAVRLGNEKAKDEGLPAITVAQFREMLPQTLSAFAASVLNED